MEAALVLSWPTDEGLLSQGSQSTLQRYRDGTLQGFALRCRKDMLEKHTYFPQHRYSRLVSAQERISNVFLELHSNQRIYRDLHGQQSHPQKFRAITNRRNLLCSSVTSISKGGEMAEDSNFFLPRAAASLS